MIQVKNSSGSLISEYLYNSEGRRVKKIEYEEGSNTTTYYIGNAFVRVSNSSGDYNETYYHDNDKLIAENNTNNDLIYYHPDHLGSTTLITSSAGNLVEETFYLPFGDVIDGGDSRFTYTGQESDSETGLMYYGSRYYDTEMRHFVQADPVIGDLYNPQDLNHYAYVRNNPYKYIDPEGNVIRGATGRFALYYSIIIINKYGDKILRFFLARSLNDRFDESAQQIAEIIKIFEGVSGTTDELIIQEGEDSDFFEDDKDDLSNLEELEDLNFQNNLNNILGGSSTQEQSLKEVVKIVTIPQEKITLLP